MTSIISGIHPILREPGILHTCSNDPIFLSLHSRFKMVLPIYIALASAVVLFENFIFPIIQPFQPLVTVENFLWLIPRTAGIIQRMIQPKSTLKCNGGPSPVPRPKVLPEGRPILHSYNYTLTINNNYRADHYCSRFSYYYKNQSSTM